MSEVEDIRAEAADMQRIAVGRRDWCAEEKVQLRYAKIPDALRSIERAADGAMRGARRLRCIADDLEAGRLVRK